MPKFANFVQCSLVAGITAGATTIQVEAQSPFNLPADPGGQNAYITLMDDLNVPTRFEIVGYTGVTTIDATSLELTGCTRAQQGTTAQSWSAGHFARQDVTALALAILELDFQNVYVASEDETVRSYTLSGTPVWVNDDSEEPVRTVDVGAQAVYAGNDGGKVLKINRKSGALEWISGTHSLDVVKVMEGPGGSVYSLSTSNGGPTADSRLEKHDADGNLLWSYTESGWGVTAFDIDSSGFVYLVEDNALYKIHPAGFKLIEETKSGGGGSIHVSEDGFVYSMIDSAFRKYDKDLQQVATWVTEAGDRPRILEGVASSNSDGSVYVLGAIELGGTTYEIAKLDAAGDFVWGVDIGLNTTLLFVDSIQVLPSGDVIFVDGLAQEAYVYSNEGTLVTTISDMNANPIGVAAYPTPSKRYVRWSGTEFEVAPIKDSDVTGKPDSNADVVFHDRPEPETPASGYCVVYMDSTGGALKVKFSNGTVKTISTP